MDLGNSSESHKSSIVLSWYEEFVSAGDPRTKDWVGVSTPWLTLGTMFVYLLLIAKILPWYMKDREPFKIRGLLIVYNTILSVYSLVSFLTIGIGGGWFYKVNYRCYPNDFSVNPEINLMLNSIWGFWISKFVELLDTVFFVLRKKDRQVTLLHVYHHCSMIFNVWITIKLCAVGHFSFIGVTNTFVHFPMYAYYGLAAVGPHMQKYLGWKKYITKIQLIQFIMNIVHGGQVLFNKCDVSMAIAHLSIGQSFVFFLLFLNFYSKAYRSKDVDATRSCFEKQSEVKANLKDSNSSFNDSNGDLKSFCNWSTVSSYENKTLGHGSQSHCVPNGILSNANSTANKSESSLPRLRKRTKKE